MQFHELKSVNKKSKQVGRGGKRGKTSGRGHKGQKARAGHKIRPEIRDLIKKIPKRRGYGKNRSRTYNPDKVKPIAINVEVLDSVFGNGDKVTPEILLDKGLIKVERNTLPPVKILATGDIKTKVEISGCMISDTARKKVEKAGGNIK